jgi:signal transduction histidine kinase
VAVGPVPRRRQPGRRLESFGRQHGAQAGQGTGTGLTIVPGVVERHGASVAACGERGVRT